MNTIQQGWDGYVAAILKPAGVVPGSVQYVETKRAFFAGSSHLFKLVMDASDSLSEDAAAAVLSGVSEELVGFFKSVGKGN